MAIATSARLTTKRTRAAALPAQVGQSPPSPQFAETKKRYKTTSTGTPVRRHPAVPKCGSLSLKAWGDYGLPAMIHEVGARLSGRAGRRSPRWDGAELTVKAEEVEFHPC